VKITKATLALPTALALTISCALSAANAGTISVHVGSAVNSPNYDLTNVHGTDDWAYWAGTGNPEPGTPSNDKSGSTLIGDMSPVGGGALRGSGSSSKPLYDFVFTDGTSGDSPAENLIGLFNTQLDTIGAGVQVNVTSPTADPFKIYVWATAFAAEATFTATVGAASDSATYTSTANRTPGAFYTITVDPDTSGETVNLQLTLTSDNGASAHVSLAGVAVTGNTSGGGGATISVDQEITGITSTGSTLTSITYAGTTYGSLSVPTAMLSNEGSTDWLHIGGTEPANLAEACGSLDLSIGSLNHSFEAQFSGLTDSSLVFLLSNGPDTSQNGTATVYPVDAAGNRLGGVSSTITFGNGTTPSFTDLTGLQSYNRTTAGSGSAPLDRLLLGMAFTLEDLAFDNLGATGLEIATTNLDLHEIGWVESATTADLKITSFTSVGGGTWELTLVGDPATAYEFRSSATLEFTPGTLIENLTQGNPGTDPGTIGGANDSVLTDINGDGTVRMALTGNPADFVRAQTIP